MTIKLLITPPSSEPMTVAEAKTFLRTDNDTNEEDALLARLIKQARMKIEKDTRGRALMTQTWEIGMMYWPRQPYLQLPIAPVQSVTSYAYTTATGLQTFAQNAYVLDSRDDRQLPLLRMASAWPTAALVPPNGLRARLVFGYTTVPEDLLGALRSLVAYWYDNREAALASTAYKAEVAVLPLQYGDLIAPYVLQP
jgi:uncharacterized phiE125 gp8 family phage protein